VSIRTGEHLRGPATCACVRHCVPVLPSAPAAPCSSGATDFQASTSHGHKSARDKMADRLGRVRAKERAAASNTVHPQGPSETSRAMISTKRAKASPESNLCEPLPCPGDSGALGLSSADALPSVSTQGSVNSSTGPPASSDEAGPSKRLGHGQLPFAKRAKEESLHIATDKGCSDTTSDRKAQANELGISTSSTLSCKASTGSGFPCISALVHQQARVNSSGKQRLPVKVAPRSALDKKATRNDRQCDKVSYGKFTSRGSGPDTPSLPIATSFKDPGEQVTRCSGNQKVLFVCQY
jgi:hypothetical protein